ncbi:MAG TPA: hypothetical protein VFM27_16860 [Acidimicrobiales bacterium]|nr:hypothetical protein [Acidimicrobiales bacterium]
MRRVRVAAAVAAGLAVLALVTPPALADPPPATGTITVEPLSGPPGLPFLFSGEGCVSEAGPGLVEVLALLGDELIATLPPEFAGVDSEGNWRVGMVPNGFLGDEAAVGDWHATATCRDAETGEPIVEYAAAPFTVTAPPAPPAPPTTSPPAPTTTVPAPAPAPPAAPVAARPTFTG